MLSPHTQPGPLTAKAVFPLSDNSCRPHTPMRPLKAKLSFSYQTGDTRVGDVIDTPPRYAPCSVPALPTSNAPVCLKPSSPTKSTPPPRNSPCPQPSHTAVHGAPKALGHPSHHLTKRYVLEGRYPLSHRLISTSSLPLTHHWVACPWWLNIQLAK